MTARSERQEARAATLRAEGFHVYTDGRMGRKVIEAFERYLETGDAAKISPALRDHLMMREGFIAHFDLGGFRHAYRDVRELIGELAQSWRFDGEEFHDYPLHGRYVYTDGLDSQDVRVGLQRAFRKGAGTAIANAEDAQRGQEIALAIELAERHGLKVTR